jgi:DNA-binding NtrC family response regulator
MVRWFAEQAGGAVQLTSVVGQGTTVALWIPGSTDGVIEPSEGTMPLSTLPTGTERIVVVAPDEEVRATIRQILEVLGYSVTFTEGGETMLANLLKERPQMLIVDGPESGDSALLQRARVLLPELKVLATTEGPRSVAVDAASGAALLVKPFTLAELAGAVRRALDESAASGSAS